MFNPLFDRVLRIVKDWAPKEEYSIEEGYRNELMSYLRQELNRVGPFEFAPRKHKIQKEHGRSLADIAVDGKIGIELKKDLKSRPAIDRLRGQVSRFRKDYSDIILVLCGNIDESAYEEVRELERTANPFEQQGNIAVLRKDKKKGAPKGPLGDVTGWPF